MRMRAKRLGRRVDGARCGRPRAVRQRQENVERQLTPKPARLGQSVPVVTTSPTCTCRHAHAHGQPQPPPPPPPAALLRAPHQMPVAAPLQTATARISPVPRIGPRTSACSTHVPRPHAIPEPSTQLSSYPNSCHPPALRRPQICATTELAGKPSLPVPNPSSFSRLTPSIPRRLALL